METKNTVPVGSVDTGDNQKPTIKWSDPDPIPLGAISWNDVPRTENFSEHTLVWDAKKERDVEWYTEDQLSSIEFEIDKSSVIIDELGWDNLMVDKDSEQYKTIAMGLKTISTLSHHSMGVGDRHDVKRFAGATLWVQYFYDDWINNANSEINQHYGVDIEEVDEVLLNCKRECVNEYVKLCDPKVKCPINGLEAKRVRLAQSKGLGPKL